MSRKEKREEIKEHKSEPKKKITIKLPNIKELPKKEIIYLVVILIAIAVALTFFNYSSIGLVINKSITDEDVVKVDLIGSNNKIYSY